jgi:NADH:ubiquinone oxidoreductase subunit E
MSLTSRVPGLGIAKGMLTGLVRFFQPKVTVQYPEQRTDVSPRHRGRLILLYDEIGNLKCETCFQCAMACPIEIIDMGGVDTKNRMHVHWGPPEQYAERREESALRRSGRPVPDRTFRAWLPIDLGPLEQILVDEDYDPRRLLRILQRTQDEYGHLPVAGLQHISHATGAWYSEIYGIATSYPSLRFEPGWPTEISICRCPSCLALGGGALRRALEDALATQVGGVSPDGTVRLSSIDCGGESTDGPRLAINGQLQPAMTVAAAGALARDLRAKAQPAASA